MLSPPALLKVFTAFESKSDGSHPSWVRFLCVPSAETSFDVRQSALRIDTLSQGFAKMLLRPLVKLFVQSRRLVDCRWPGVWRWNRL